MLKRCHVNVLPPLHVQIEDAFILISYPSCWVPTTNFLSSVHGKRMKAHPELRPFYELIFSRDGLTFNSSFCQCRKLLNMFPPATGWRHSGTQYSACWPLHKVASEAGGHLKYQTNTQVGPPSEPNICVDAIDTSTSTEMPPHASPDIPMQTDTDEAHRW